MPLGSSSEAPVISPGPSALTQRRTALARGASGIAAGAWIPSSILKSASVIAHRRPFESGPTIGFAHRRHVDPGQCWRDPDFFEYGPIAASADWRTVMSVRN